MNTQVGFHKPSGRVILINEARSGLDCHCVCLDCNKPLIAVVNFKDTHATKYFQHYNPDSLKESCTFSGSSGETALHLALKRAISKTKVISVPPIFITRQCTYPGYNYPSFIARKGGTIKFDDVIEEQRLGNLIPDCIGIINGHRILIEVKVTHGIDGDKKRKLRLQGLDCLELYAPPSMASESPESIIKNLQNYEWINETISDIQSVKRAANDWFAKQRSAVEKRIAAKAEIEVEQDISKRVPRIKKLYAKEMRGINHLKPNMDHIHIAMDADIRVGVADYEFDRELFYRYYPDKLFAMRDSVASTQNKIQMNNSLAASDFLNKWSKAYQSIYRFYDFCLEENHNYPKTPRLGDPESVNQAIDYEVYVNTLKICLEVEIHDRHYDAWREKRIERFGGAVVTTALMFDETPQSFTATKEYNHMIARLPSIGELREISKLGTQYLELEDGTKEVKELQDQKSRYDVEIKAQLFIAISKVMSGVLITEEQILSIAQAMSSPNQIGSFENRLDRYVYEHAANAKYIAAEKAYLVKKKRIWPELNVLSNDDIKRRLNL